MSPSFNIEHATVRERAATQHILVDGLTNPRGLHFDTDGDLWVTEAGGAEAHPPYTGRLTVRDAVSGAVKTTELDGYRALNMQPRMRRDEIIGLTDLAPTADEPDRTARGWMIAFTDYINGTKVLELNADGVLPVFETTGNINSLCFAPRRGCWYGVRPDTNEVLEFVRRRPVRAIRKLPDLALGQEAVPVNLVYHELRDKLYISLLSGERNRAERDRGIDFGKHQGAVVSVDPSSGELEYLVTGLTLPTALGLDEYGQILVTELCSDCLEPLAPDHAPTTALHGGFKRFSGRLLKIDVHQKTCIQLASQLDTPSNLAVHRGWVYLSEGMGLPGRAIPTPWGVQPLRGFIRKVVN